MPADPLDGLLDELGLGGQDQSGGGGRGGGQNKKNNSNSNSKDNKLTGNGVQKAKPVETVYDGYNLRPLSPKIGDKKTWSRVSRTAMLFSSAQLYSMGDEHRKRKAAKGIDVAGMYRLLNPNQQGVVDRVIKEKMRDETQKEATWELYDIRKVNQTVRRRWTTDVEVVALEVIVRRVDKNKVIDKPSGTTANANKLSSEDIIDLEIPMKEKKKNNNNNNDVKNQGGGKQQRDPLDSLLSDLDLDGGRGGRDRDRDRRHDRDDSVVNVPPSGQQYRGHDHAEQHYQRSGDYVWNGFEWQYDPEDHEPQQHMAQAHHVPQAPVPPNHGHGYENPFLPAHTHPAAYDTAQPVLFGETPRRMHSRSRSRPRTPHRGGPPSLISSRTSESWSPPRTPELIPARARGPKGSLYRREIRYVPDRHYREEDYEVRIDRDVDYYKRQYIQPSALRGGRVTVHHEEDDYPRRRLTNFAEGHDDDDADFLHERRRSRGVDMLRERPRRDKRYYDERRSQYYVRG